MSETLELVGPTAGYAARLPATVKLDKERAEFDLPVWSDRDGKIRIGLPRREAKYSGDFMQAVVSPADLLRAVAYALEHPDA